MRLTGAVLIFLASSMCGFFAALRLKGRQKKLEQARRYIYSLCEEIRLTRAELPDAINRVKACGVYLKDGAWQGLEGLNTSDLLLLNSFLLSLGKTDLEGQISNARLHIGALDERISEAKEEKEKLSRLYVSLGILGGLFAAVLVI